MFNKKRIIIFVVFILLMFFMTTFAGTPVQNAAIAMRDVIFTDGYNGKDLAKYTIEVGKDVTPPETPKHEGYAFAGWFNYTDRKTRVNSFDTILNDLHVIALYGEDLNKNGIVDSDEEHYLVSFVNSINEEVIKEEEVLVGMDATAPKAPAINGYRFVGWDRSYRNITSDLTVYTVYNRTTNSNDNDDENETKTFTVTFIDGVTNRKISSVSVREGLSAGTPKAPAHEGKEFDKWQGNYTNVRKNETVTAIYKDIKYLIKFVNDDGTVLQADDVVYGNMPEYTGDVPAKEATAEYTYAFTGWDKEIVVAKADATYTATYESTKNKYTIKFVNDDNTELQSERLEYGVTPSYKGETPTKEETAEYTYTFKGWDKDITSVTGDTTYTAEYDAVKKKYLIQFMGYDGSILQSERLEYGVLPEYKGDKPTKPADAQYTYTFRGWDKRIAAVTVNENYIAQFKETLNSYTVKFVDEDGTELQSSEVAYGNMPAYNGTIPSKDPTAEYTYTFAGWDKEFATVESNQTYTATYESTKNKYTIKFNNEDGTELQSSEVEYGVTPEYTGTTPTKTTTDEFTYTFKEWTPEVVAVTGNATYPATYTSTTNKYTVTWKNEDGTVLETDENVTYGTMPTYDGAKPTKTATAEYTYAFKGWDKELKAVIGDITYTAEYDSTKNKYTVKFVNDDGTELQSSEVEYGVMATYNSTIPTKPATTEYTYTFAGWDKDLAIVTDNVTYTAEYDSVKNKYTVIFENEDGTELQNTKVEYGVVPTAPANPTKPATEEFTYTFAGWDKEIVAVEGNQIYTATYTSTTNKYTVTWKNEDGTVLETDENVTYGTVPTYDGAKPTKAATVEFTYTFDGWTPEVVAVTGNKIYTATYTSKKNSYTIEIDPKCETGENCTDPEDPTAEFGSEVTLPEISRSYKLYFSVDGNTNVINPIPASATLLGYCLEGTDCSTLVDAGSTVTVTGNAKYNAVWNTEGLTITSELPNANDDLENGKKFKDWRATNSATSAVVNIPIRLTSDKTIYAHFGITNIKVEVTVGGDISNGNIEYDQELIYTVKITNTGDTGGDVFVIDSKLKEAIASGLVELESGNTNEAKAIVQDGLSLTNVTGTKTITLKLKVKANAGDKVNGSLSYKVDGYDKTPVTTHANVEKTISFIGKSERLVGSNVVIVMDKSASMDENNKTANAKAAAKAFIDSIFVDNNTNAYGTTISVVTFGTKWEYAEDEAKYNRLKYCVEHYYWGWPYDDCEALYNSLENSPSEKVTLETIATDYATAQTLKNEIDTKISDTTDYYGGSGTPYYAGFELANEVLAQYTTGNNKNDNQNVVIFLTDGEPELDDETKRQTELNKLEEKGAIIYAIGFDMNEFKCTKWNYSHTECKKYSTTERTDEYKLLKRITDYQHSDGYADRVIMSGVSGLIDVFENLGSRISSEPKSVQTSNGRLDMGQVIAVDKKHPIIVSLNGTEATANNEKPDNTNQFIVYNRGVKDSSRTFANYAQAMTAGYLTHDDTNGYDINASKFEPADKIKVEFYISFSE